MPTISGHKEVSKLKIHPEIPNVCQMSCHDFLCSQSLKWEHKFVQWYMNPTHAQTRHEQPDRLNIPTTGTADEKRPSVTWWGSVFKNNIDSYMDGWKWVSSPSVNVFVTNSVLIHLNWIDGGVTAPCWSWVWAGLSAAAHFLFPMWWRRWSWILSGSGVWTVDKLLQGGR